MPLQNTEPTSLPLSSDRSALQDSNSGSTCRKSQHSAKDCCFNVSMQALQCCRPDVEGKGLQDALMHALRSVG
jgi:hypothetical protein